jgi:hypothetical protein
MPDRLPLRPVRRRDALHRLLYVIEHPGPDGRPVEHTVEIDAVDLRAVLYVDGRYRDAADLPAAFGVHGGTLEVALSLYGVQRMHLVTDDRSEQRLTPVAGTLEDLRHRFHRRHPWTSRVIGGAAILVLLVNLVLAVPEALEILTRADRIAEVFGTFTSPVALPSWLTIGLLVAGVLAAVDRALMLRRNRVVDLETIWTNF